MLHIQSFIPQNVHLQQSIYATAVLQPYFVQVSEDEFV